MHPFPHQYQVAAQATANGDVTLAAQGLTSLPSDAPAEFDGPGNRWSPEMLLTAAVADCFVLSFRSIARASKFSFDKLEVETKGTLDRVANVNRFTHFFTTAKLSVPPGTDRERAKKLLEKAEQICLITNSLSAERHLDAIVLE